MLEINKNNLKVFEVLGVSSVALSFIDCLLTMFGISKGFEEGNKFMIFLMDKMGIPFALLFYFIITTYAVFYLLRKSEKSRLMWKISFVVFATRNAILLNVVTFWIINLI